ncbi:hypothetical protein D9M70_536980 [compost metagenome]
MRAGTATACQNGDLLRPIENVCEFRNILIGRDHTRKRDRCPVLLRTFRRLLERDITRNDNHRHAALADGRTHGTVQHFGHLRRIGNQLDKMAAFAEEFLRMGFLKIIKANFR